jgi:hypothetical protein
LAQQAEHELAQGNLPDVDKAAITSDLSVLGVSSLRKSRAISPHSKRQNCEMSS